MYGFDGERASTFPLFFCVALHGLSDTRSVKDRAITISRIIRLDSGCGAAFTWFFLSPKQDACAALANPNHVIRWNMGIFCAFSRLFAAKSNRFPSLAFLGLDKLARNMRQMPGSIHSNTKE
jgi:hypothetical protein